MRLPKPFPRIKDLDDHKVVSLLLGHIEWATDEFFYGKSYPIFKFLHNKYHTLLRVEIMDFIHDIYIDIIGIRKQAKTCKLATFTFKSTLNTWIGVVSSRFCYAVIQKDKVNAATGNTDDGDRFFDDFISNSINDNIFDMEDVNKMLSAMRNPRYRELIRKRYVEGKTNEETAVELGMEMDNYYNRHRLAKAQFVNVLKEEGLL